LTPFQIEVAQLFFSLSASRGFLLAGGAALAAQRLTVRPTRDLDLFTSPGHGVVSNARAALELAARQRGWAAEPVREGQDFVRLVIESNDDNVVVDLAVDAAPECPATMTIAGPTLDPTELAGRKVVALFDRAEARDFADVYALVARYGTDRLLTWPRGPIQASTRRYSPTCSTPSPASSTTRSRSLPVRSKR